MGTGRFGKRRVLTYLNNRKMYNKMEQKGMNTPWRRCQIEQNLTHFLCLTLSLYNSRYEHHRDLNNGLNEAGHLYHLCYQLYLYLNYVNKLN